MDEKETPVYGTFHNKLPFSNLLKKIILTTKSRFLALRRRSLPCSKIYCLKNHPQEQKNLIVLLGEKGGAGTNSVNQRDYVVVQKTDTFQTLEVMRKMQYLHHKKSMDMPKTVCTLSNHLTREMAIFVCTVLPVRTFIHSENVLKVCYRKFPKI